MKPLATLITAEASGELTRNRGVLLVEVGLGIPHRDLFRIAQFDDPQFRFGLRCFVHDQLLQLRFETTLAGIGVVRSQVSRLKLLGP